MFKTLDAPASPEIRSFSGGVVTKQRILVTGGAGFIGNRLCRRLVAQGHRVVSLDNYLSGRERNLTGLFEKANFEALRHDVRDPLPRHLSVDQIYNLACLASPVFYQKDPICTMMTNVQGALHVLELAKRTGAKVLQASTSEVYGDPELHPQYEDYTGNVNTQGPRACYDEGKRAAEALFYDFRHQFGVRTKIARIFNTYGPNMQLNDGRVVSNFAVQALSGAPLTIYGDGRQTRSFCYVDDMVDGLMALMETPDDVTGPVNIGNPEEVTIAELAEQIGALSGASAQIVYHAAPKDDPKRRCPDIGKMASLTGWAPQVPLSAGLQETIAYFRTELGSPERELGHRG